MREGRPRGWSYSCCRLTSRSSCRARSMTVSAFCRSLAPQRILQTMLREQAIKDMLVTEASDATFALRAKIIQFPEGIASVWTMLAVRCNRTTL